MVVGDGIGRGNFVAVGRDEPDARAADGAGIGLRVEAAVVGSSYSAWQAAHILKRAMEVCGRS